MKNTVQNSMHNLESRGIMRLGDILWYILKSVSYPCNCHNKAYIVLLLWQMCVKSCLKVEFL